MGRSALEYPSINVVLVRDSDDDGRVRAMPANEDAPCWSEAAAGAFSSQLTYDPVFSVFFLPVAMPREVAHPLSVRPRECRRPAHRISPARNLDLYACH